MFTSVNGGHYQQIREDVTQSKETKNHSESRGMAFCFSVKWPNMYLTLITSNNWGLVCVFTC